jgi:hypothetical protein
MNLLDLTKALSEPNLRAPADTTVQIAVHRLSLSGQATVGVVSARFGIDWNVGQLILSPAQPLLALTQEQAGEITASWRKGSTIAGYEQYKAAKSEGHRQVDPDLCLRLDAIAESLERDADKLRETDAQHSIAVSLDRTAYDVKKIASDIKFSLESKAT